MEPDSASRWQAAWQREGLSSGRRVPGRGKFFALIAYPGPSGFFHVGHLRSYAFADALHRFHRSLGEAVLFPFGVHASGLPAVTWSQKVKDRDPVTIATLENAAVPSDRWKELEQPEYAVRFLGESYRRVLRKLGVLVDEDSYLTTMDDDYRAFVQWQMRAVGAKGGFVQASYFASVCPVCGPVAVDPSETDLSSGGDADVARFTTVPFRLADGRKLLAATLRPETVYGVTNLWVAPGSELVVWHRGPDEFIVARAGGERLVAQHGGRIGHSLPAAELVGRSARVPLTGTSVPILSSRLVDPEIGTGVVMSVPAHAPADAAALSELSDAERASLPPPRILLEIPAGVALTSSEEEMVDGAGTPAERALRVTGAKGLSDRTAVDAATERLYRIEYVRGRMTVPPLEGVPVRQARERVAATLAKEESALELQEFSKPVVCRNGHVVEIRRVPNQWFIRYSDPGWKSRTRAAAGQLVTWPPEYASELPGIIDWFADRPCARKGRWLGTPFPLDPSWIVEPIADSTFYTAYFVVRRFVARGRLNVAQMTDAFFDFVFQGVGPGEPAVPAELQTEIREEFLYWYPLDINMGGKEHKRVHFPVFLYTHTLLLPPELQPRAIFVNGWITGPGGAKLSKKEVASKGGRVPPIDEALARWGPDPLRLYYMGAASPTADVEWNSETVDAARSRLEDVERLARETRGPGRGPPELDAWLASAFHRLVLRVRSGLEAADLRGVAELVYVSVPTLLRRYYARGGVSSEATDRIGRAWILLMAPITPHLAEELGDGRLSGLVATQPFPRPEEFPLSEDAEGREEFLQQVEDDLRAVLRPAAERGEPIPEEVAFFVASPWKRTVESWMRDQLARGETPSIREVMERTQQHAELAAHRAEIPKYVQRVGPLLRAEPASSAATVDELSSLRAAEGYLVRRFGFRSVAVHEEAAGEPFDPMGRRERSRPGKPAIYLVRPGRPRPERPSGTPLS